MFQSVAVLELHLLSSLCITWQNVYKYEDKKSIETLILWEHIKFYRTRGSQNEFKRIFLLYSVYFVFKQTLVLS